MSERDLGKRIAQHLDGGLDNISPSVIYRLRTAREAALERAHQDEPAIAMVGTRTLSGMSGWRANRRFLASVTALVLALLIIYWQQLQQPARTADNADIDAQMLSDDLPVTAYTDLGFEVWLREHSPRPSEQ
jgi:hypothetical protein